MSHCTRKKTFDFGDDTDDNLNPGISTTAWYGNCKNFEKSAASADVWAVRVIIVRLFSWL